MEEMRGLSAEHERLKRKVAACKKCSQAAVPGSGPYAQMVAQLHAAEEELRIFGERVSGISITVLESLQEDYHNLFATPVKESDVAANTLSTCDDSKPGIPVGQGHFTVA